MQKTEARTAQAQGQGWVLALTAVAALMVVLDQLVVATALNTIRQDLHASIETLEWTVNAFSLSLAVLLMTGSALGDRLGRRRVFVTGLVVFTVASAACGLAQSTGWLITARVIQGAGAALVMPLALALLSAAYPAQARGRALGIFTAVTGLAVVGGPLVGGAITEGLAWRWIFLLNVPIGVVLIPLVLARIKESSGPASRIDAGGLLLSAGGALGLVWGLVRGNDAGWSSAEVLGSLIAGAALTAGFVVWELRVSQPMLPMRFFRIPAFAAGNAAAFLTFGAVISMVFFLSQYLQVSLGYGPLGAGVRTLPWTAILFCVAPFAGARADVIGSRLLISLGLFGQALGFGWMALSVHDGLGYASLVPGMLIAGFGVSMAMPANQNAVLNAVPHTAIGKASGTFTMVRQLGGVFCIAVLSAVFAANGDYASPAAFTAGVVPAFWAASGLSLLGSLAGLGTPGRRRSLMVRERPLADQPAGSDTGSGSRSEVKHVVS